MSALPGPLVMTLEYAIFMQVFFRQGPQPSIFGPNNSQNGPVKLVLMEHGWYHLLTEGPWAGHRDMEHGHTSKFKVFIELGIPPGLSVNMHLL